MTPYELATQLSPQVREAAERSKADILESLTPMKRIVVKSVWNIAMRDGVPAALRIFIEFLIAKYRKDLEPLVGDMVNILLKSIDEEKISDSRLILLRDILELLRTPEYQFLPSVLSTLDPNLPRIIKDYSSDDVEV